MRQVIFCENNCIIPLCRGIVLLNSYDTAAHVVGSSFSFGIVWQSNGEFCRLRHIKVDPFESLQPPLLTAGLHTLRVQNESAIVNVDALKIMEYRY
jgi:hypothetical protein